MGAFQAIKSFFSSKVTVASLIPTWQSGQAEFSETKLENMIKHGWRRNELIYSCISKKGKTAPQVELKVYDKASGVEIPNHPLKRLIQKPNPEMSEYDFWYSILVYQQLSGKALFEKERSERGKLIGLWPLRPDWVKVKMRNRVEIEKYIYEPPGITNPPELGPKDVVAFRVWDPEGLFSTWPPVAVASRSGDTDNDMTELLKVFFQEGGTPMGIITSKLRLRQDAVDDIRARWRQRYGGWRNWMDPAVLDSDATYQRIGLTFREMGFEVLDARSEARICMVLDVPPILVGAKIGLDRATYSNYAEARKSWWEDSLVPIYTDLLDVVINQILPEFDDSDRITVKWDFSRVPALQESQNIIWSRAREGFTAGAITVNEFREMVGLKSYGPAGDVFLRSPQQLAIPITQSTNLSEPIEGAAQLGHFETKALLSSPSDERRREFEEKMTERLVEFFIAQKTRVLQKVKDEHPNSD